MSEEPKITIEKKKTPKYPKCVEGGKWLAAISKQAKEGKMHKQIEWQSI